jgi:hypothetical protein
MDKNHDGISASDVDFVILCDLIQPRWSRCCVDNVGDGDPCRDETTVMNDKDSITALVHPTLIFVMQPGKQRIFILMVLYSSYVWL